MKDPRDWEINKGCHLAMHGDLYTFVGLVPDSLKFMFTSATPLGTKLTKERRTFESVEEAIEFARIWRVTVIVNPDLI